MRVRAILLCLAAGLTACGRTSAATPSPVPHAEGLQVTPIVEANSPSPLVQVQAGSVRGVVPRGWDARMLPAGSWQQGFEASPSISAWERGAVGIPGIEAFWVDIDKVGIPSDLYYLAARNVSFGRLQGSLDCQPAEPRVIVNHPPDFTGTRFSPSDYVASGRGSCVLADGTPARWAYMVAAPGFGPAREVGIPTSGLYVVMAEVSGPHAEVLIREMLAQARFGDASIPQLVRAAGSEQPN